MNGLERRLRSVAGVADLTIELGDSGLDGIRVRVEEGSDEAEVLEDIRRILVAYGLRSRRAESAGPVLPSLVEPENPSSEGGGAERVRVRPTGAGLVVEVSNASLSVSETGHRSPIGVAEAMIRAVARFRGMARPDRIAFALDELDGSRVVTMLARRGRHTAVAAKICEPSLSTGLFQAADAVLFELEGTSDTA